MFEKFVVKKSDATVTYYQNGVSKFTKSLCDLVSVHGSLESFKNWAVKNGISFEVKA